MKSIFSIAVSLLLGMSAFANSNTNPYNSVPLNSNKNVSDLPLSTQVDNGQYQQVDFTVDGTRFQMLNASEDGSLFRVIRHDDADNLSQNILSKLHRYYKGKTILGATEVQFKNGTVYQANLEDANHIYEVFIGPDGYMHLLNKFNKAQ